MDLELIIESLSFKNLPSENDIQIICNLVRDILIAEPVLVNISSPVTVCGDIHGQFSDLLHIFELGGPPQQTKYLFLGDYVDRGYHSLETILYLFLLKIRHPQNITLLRGNHETREINSVYGFYHECTQRSSIKTWNNINNVFQFLPLTALIDNKIFSVHGGLSPYVNTLDEIRKIVKRSEIIGPATDLLWSDPDDSILGWKISPRGTGYIFGCDPVQRFNHINGLDLICRSHQLVMKGYQYYFDQKLLTLWSAPNYVYRCGNSASILQIDGSSHSFINFEQESEIPTLELSDDEEYISDDLQTGSIAVLFRPMRDDPEVNPNNFLLNLYFK